VTASGAGSFELGTDGPGVIMVGTDGSTTAARAGWYAAGLARRQRARVVAVYVQPMATLASSLPAAGAGLAAVERESFGEIAEDIRRRIDETSRELGIAATFITAQGDPFTELVRVADEIRADAVIVGASAKAGHRWVGSLAVRLVRAGRWPVTVVP
jgi:nucleotide-binding universal stress UspA family protein